MSAPVTRRRALVASAAAALGIALGTSPALASGAPLPVAHPDAGLIDFAGRVERLVQRTFAMQVRRGRIEDRVFLACRRPKEPEIPAEFTSTIGDVETEAGRVLTIVSPPGRYEAYAERDRLHAIALAAHKRGRRAMEARLGLPAVERLADRMWSRLIRWTAALAERPATTSAGVAAKAAVCLALVEDTKGRVDEISAGQFADLIASALRDAIRLGGGAHV